MSVRRLAADKIQPSKFAFTPENLVWANEIITKYPPGKQASAVIPLLWRAQEQHDGWLPKPAMEHVAEMLGMSFIRVYEVATFYTMFQLSPVGKKAHVQVCGTTPCMLRGAEDLVKVCKRKIAAQAHTVSADGAFSWEEVECLGACVNAPMIQIFKDTYEDLTPEMLERILEDVAAGKDVRPGPQVERHNSAPAGGFTTLVDPDLYNGSAVMKPGSAAAESQDAETAKPAAKKAASRKSPAKKLPAKKAEKLASTEATRPEPQTLVSEKAVKPPAQKTASDAGNEGGKKPAAKKSQPAKKAPAKKATGTGEQAGKPRAIRKPAKPDDLKLISGVGPKLEGVLNGLGIYKWSQIAKWQKAEVDWVDDYLSFKGRIERDNWVDQADALAKGGVDEYARRFGKKPR